MKMDGLLKVLEEEYIKYNQASEIAKEAGAEAFKIGNVDLAGRFLRQYNQCRDYKNALLTVQKLARGKRV